MSDRPAAQSVLSGAIVALLVVQVLFGSLPVFGKLAMASFGASGVAAIRIVGGAAVFQVARAIARARARARGQALPPAPTARDHALLALCAALGIASNQLLFLFGLARTSATHASILVTTVPVFTVLFAVVAGREAASVPRLAGIGLAAAGAVVLLTGRGIGAGDPLGDALVLANCLVYAIYLVISRDVVARVGPLDAVSWFFAWATPMVLLVTGVPSWRGHPPGAWLAAGWVLLGPTVGTYFLNLFALREVPSSLVATWIYLQPAVAAALAWALLDERLTARAVVAGLTIFAGVLLASRRWVERPDSRTA